tara:strand:- start:888 stop:2633 length:1746 start_codon:yes stop_codon:yes gene_type:complete
MENNKFPSIISYKNFELIFFSILFLYFSSLNIYQMHDQHWTAMLDQDIKIIYNSLLVSSGYEQEYRHHPAYTTFLILGGIFKVCSLFFDNFTLQEVLSSNMIDQEFQKLFYIGRIVNSIYIFLIIFFIYKVLREFKISRSIALFAISFSVFFMSFYELLFLIRSEVVSILMFLISFYFLIKFFKTNNIFHILLTGLFFGFSMLAKIQIVFLFLTTLIALPFLINYFSASDRLNYLIKNSKILGLSKIVLILFILLFILIQTFLAKIFLENLNDAEFTFLQNEDSFFFLFFVVFYFIFIKVLSKYNLVDSSQITVSLGLIISGFALCLIFVLLLDISNLIPFNKLNLIKLSNPIKFMTMHTFEVEGEKSIIITLKALTQALAGKIELSAEFNEEYNPTILNIDTKIFFRNLHLLLFLSLMLLSSFLKRNKISIYLSAVFFTGIIIYYLTFLLRETIGYNIFVFPLYLILFSILLNNLDKKYLLIFSSIFYLVFMIENIYLSSMYKNIFKREPQVYSFCGIDKWKNSENYEENYNNQSYIKLVAGEDRWIRTFASKFYEVAYEYCIQLRDEEGNRESKFKINS